MSTAQMLEVQVTGTGRTAALRRLLHTPVGVAALAADLLLILLVIFGPIIWGHAAAVYDTNHINQGPTAAHIFGTDNLGRDILLRILVAARLSLGLAMGATLIGAVVGLVLGTIPVVVGHRFGRFVVAAVNVAVAFPGLLLALFFTSIFGASPWGAMLALGIAFAPSFGRLIHTLSSGIASRDYVSAARMAGVGRIRIVGRHILPNIAETLIINVTLASGAALLAFAGLSFLGLGVQPPSFDWGRMLNEGLNGIYVNPTAALAPGMAIVLAGLALNLTGEAAAALSARRVVATWRREHTAASSARVARASDSGDVAGIAHDRSAAGRGDAVDTVLEVRNLRVSFPGAGAAVTPVRGVDLRIRRGEAVGVVGESGSGKSLTALAVAQLITQPGRVTADRMMFDGLDLLGERGHEVRHRLGTTMSVVFQDPMSSLNPVMRIGSQLAEVGTEHLAMRRPTALSLAVQRLRAVRVPAAERRARQFPHEFSGGMRQRAMIAMGLMGSPELLIADEPTTALDSTVQRRVLELIARVRAEQGTALLLISHDMAVVSALCDRIVVMYAGRVVEDIPTEALLAGPRHPYTRALIAAVPTLDTDRDRPLSTIAGRPPSPTEFPPGCAFAPRCPFATDICRTDPALRAIGPSGALVACHHRRSRR